MTRDLSLWLARALRGDLPRAVASACFASLGVFLLIERALGLGAPMVVLPAEPPSTWPSILTIGAFAAGAAAIIAAIARAVTQIIKALHESTQVVEDTKRILVTGQIAATAASVVATSKMQEIHLLVNSNLLTKMRANLVLLKREFERTKKDADREAYQVAETELRETEASALTVSHVQANELNAQRATAVVAEQNAALARKGALPTEREQLIAAQEALVALTREKAERTKSDTDVQLYKQAQDSLALSQKLE